MDPTSHAFSRQLACMAGHAYPHATPSLQQQPDPLGMMDNPKMGPMMRALTEDDSLMSQPPISAHPGVGFPQNSYPGHQYHSSFSPGRNAQNLQFYSQGPLNASGPDYPANPLQSPGYGIGGGFGHYQRQIPTPSPVMGGGIGSPNGQHGASYPRSASAGPTIPSPIMMQGASMYSNSHTTPSTGNMYMHAIPTSSPQLSHSSPLPSRNMRSPAALHSPKSTTSPVSFSCSSPSSVNASSYGQSVSSQPICERTQNTYSASKSPSMGRTFQYSSYNQGVNPQQAQLVPNPRRGAHDQADGSVKSSSYMELINSSSPPPPPVSKQQKMDSQSTSVSVITNSKAKQTNKKENPRNDTGSLPKLEEMVAFLGEPSMNAVNHCTPLTTESQHPAKEQPGNNHVKTMQQEEKHETLQNNSVRDEDQSPICDRIQPFSEQSRKFVSASVALSETGNGKEKKTEQSNHSSKSSEDIVKLGEKTLTYSVKRTSEPEKCLVVNGEKGNGDVPQMDKDKIRRDTSDVEKSCKDVEVSDRSSETALKVQQGIKEFCATVPLTSNETVKGGENFEESSSLEKNDTKSLNISKYQRETSPGKRHNQKIVTSQNGGDEKRVGDCFIKASNEGTDEGLLSKDASSKGPPQNGNQNETSEKEGGSLGSHKYEEGREGKVGRLSEVRDHETEKSAQTGHYANYGKVTLSERGSSQGMVETVEQNQTANSCMTRKPRKEVDRTSCGDGDSGGCGEDVKDSQTGCSSEEKSCDDSKCDEQDNCRKVSTVVKQEVRSAMLHKGALDNSDSTTEQDQTLTKGGTNSSEGIVKGDIEREGGTKREDRGVVKGVVCQRILIPITKDPQDGAVSIDKFQSNNSSSDNEPVGKTAVVEGRKVKVESVNVPVSGFEVNNPKKEGDKQTVALGGDMTKSPMKLNSASIVITPLRLPGSSHAPNLKRKQPDSESPSGDQSTLPLKKRKGRPPGSKSKVKKESTSKQTKKRGRQQPSGFVDDERQELSKFKHLNQAKKVFKSRGSDSPNRGPILSIKGSIENVLSSQVVNSADGGPSKTKRVTRVVSVPSLLTPKGPTSEPSNLTVHPRGKWRCAFCGKPSFFGILGDLFGPYYPSGIQLEQSDSKETQMNNQSPSSSGTSSKNSTPKVPPNRKMPSSRSSPKSRNKIVKTYPGKTKNGPTFLSTSPPSGNVKVLKVFPVKNEKKGQTHAGPSQDKAPTSPRGWASDREVEKSEVWVHEDCLVWSQGVFSVGGILYGLHAAVKEARLVECTRCKEKGATLGCRTKGCKKAFHYLCAIEVGCLLHEHNFSMTCPQHKNKKLKMREDPT